MVDVTQIPIGYKGWSILRSTCFRLCESIQRNGYLIENINKIHMSRFFLCCIQGRIQDFKLEGAHLEKLRRAEGGAKIVGVFRVKNHDFTPKNLIFSNFRGGARRVRPPWIRPWYVYIFIAIVKQIIKRGRVVIQSNCLTLQQVFVRNFTLSVLDEDYSRHELCTWN